MIKPDCYTCKGKGCSVCNGTGKQPMDDIVLREVPFSSPTDICDVPIVEFSKREKIAAMLLQGMLSNPKIINHINYYPNDLVEQSVYLTNGLLEQLNK